jgi:sec-independent protein translocase protein TatA
MPSIGFPELLIILLVVVLLFGARKLPELGKGLGEAIKNFKQGVREGDAPPPPPPTNDGEKRSS